MISDNALLVQLKNHPETGLERLMDCYMGLVYSIVSSKLLNQSSHEDVEECVSDVFYEFYTQRNIVDLSRGSIKAYLATMAIRKAIDRFRKQKSTADYTLPIDEMEWSDGREDIERAIVTQEEKAALIRELKILGEPDCEIFIRKYFMGQSTRQVAQALQLKENTVDKKVSRGLGKLKQSLGGAL